MKENNCCCGGCGDINCEHCSKEKLKARVGILRQLLNEERITDPDKMITSEYILKVLFKDL